MQHSPVHLGLMLVLLHGLSGAACSGAAMQDAQSDGAGRPAWMHPSVVLLRDGMDSVPLDGFLFYARTARGAPDALTPSAPAIEAGLAQLDWVRARGDTINLGFTDDDVWVRIRLRNQDARERWFLRVAFPLIDRLELYEAPDRPPLVMGLALPFDRRPVRARDFVMPLVVPRGEEHEILLRFRNEDTMQLPLSLWQPEAYHVAARLETWGLGMYYGVVLVMIAYNLFLFVGVRDRTYLYYVAHILTFCLFMASQHGLAYEYLWPGSPWWAHRANPILGGASVLCAAQFARAFLRLKTIAPRMDLVLRILQGACLVHFLVSLFVPFTLAGLELSVLVGTFVAMALASAVLGIHRGFAGARLYLLAFVAILFGALIYMLKTLGVLPSAFLTHHGVLLGSLAEIVLLSLALADRIRRLEREREREHTLALESRLRLLESFARFVPHQFLRELDRESIEQVARGDAVEREMIILFTDIRGFTTMAEGMSPEDTFAFLNQYLEAMSPAIDRNRGFVDKFIGDAIMALFPGTSDDALNAAFELRRALGAFNRARGASAPVRIGVGLNRGRVILGTVGSSTRLSTTAVGDAVNLAARVERLTKLYQISVILTDAVRASLSRPDAFRLRALDTVVVRGKSEPVTLYHAYDAEEPTLRDALDATLADYSSALALYRAGHFAEAAPLFLHCLERCPEDVTARLYVERCRRYMRRPPSNWTGVSDLQDT